MSDYADAPDELLAAFEKTGAALVTFMSQNVP